MKLKYTIFTVILSAFCVVSAGAEAEVWGRYRSEISRYVAEFPAEPQITHTSMRVSDDRVIHFEEMRLVEKIEGEQNAERHYIVRLDQTYKEALRSDTRQRGELGRTVERYRNHFESLGGKISEVSDVSHSGYNGTEFMAQVPGEKDTTIRCRIYMDGDTRIQQMFIAPEQHAISAEASHFLSEFKLSNIASDIASDDPGSVEESWMEYPLDSAGHFTFLLPPVSPSCLSKAPVVQESGGRRSMSAVFLDPFYEEHTVFKAHVYDLGDDVIREGGFRSFVFANHANGSVTGYGTILSGEFRGEVYETTVDPLPGMPEIRSKLVKAYYINNYYDHSYIIVMELMGAESGSASGVFAKNILGAFNMERLAKSEGTYSGKW